MTPLFALIALALIVWLASVPMISMLFLVWMLDRYHREPAWLVFLVFCWGAVGATSTTLMIAPLFEGVFTVLLGLEDGGSMQEAFSATVIAPLVEEPSKALFLLFLLTQLEFDNITDGFVYGMAAGLGFGMTENVLYFAASLDDPLSLFMTVVIRTLYSAPMHAFATGMVGAAVGYVRWSSTSAKLAGLFGGLTAAMSLHALWNGFISYAVVTGDWVPMVLNYVLLPGIFVALLIFFEVCLWVESGQMKQQLLEEEDRGLLPAGHAAKIASVFGRRKLDLPNGVTRSHYIDAVTDLAVRKQRINHLGRKAPPALPQEVAALRAKIAGLLTG